MNAQEVLCRYVDLYLQASVRPGEESGKAAEVFCKLRDLLLAELYFMKSVRILVKEEELSGFVIYIDKRLKSIVDSYRPDKSGFMHYFSHVAEYRALSYLAEKKKKKLTACAFENYCMLNAEEVAERSPEDVYIEREERKETERRQKRLMDKVRYVCACRPSRRRNLFVFMCTLLPYLSSDAIDNFCRVLNCDRKQTFAIAEYLCSVRAGEGSQRRSRTYSRTRRDCLWIRKMEMEYAFDHSDRRNTALLDNINRIRTLISNYDCSRRKMNVEYPVLGELLNMAPSSIASAVYSSRKVLAAALGEGIPDSYIDKQAKTYAGRKQVKLDRFEPFSVFGITEKKLSRFADAS